LIAVVDLKRDEKGIYLDRSEIWIVKKGEQLSKKQRLDQNLVNEIWGESKEL